MVRSKEAPKKKPKDPLLTPPSKPRGGGFLMDDPGRPWNRGGAAMSPAPASVPSYMRGTSSSDAKAGRRGRPAASVSASASPARRMTAASVVPASASPARRRPAVRVLTRGKVLFPEEAPSSVSGSGSGLGRATCSSTMKEAKFPDALDLAPGATVAEGPAALRVCPYTYCSLNGHTHSPAVPLRSFLASRRRLIKTQQSMKLKGVSAFRKKSPEKTGGGGGSAGAKIAPLIDEEAVGDFFVEVYAGPRVSSDMSCSDMSLDEMDATVRRMEFVVFDRCGVDEDGEKGKDLAVRDDGEPESHLRLEKHGAFRDSLSECSGADTGSDFVEELPWMRYQGYEYDDSLDDEILEEQRVREEEEAGGAEISAEQEEQQGTPNRSADDFKEDAAEEHEKDDAEEQEKDDAEQHEKDDAENTSNLVCGTEITADQDFACRVEACQEPDRRDEDYILDTSCCGEASTGQGTADEQLSEDVYKSEILHQEVTGWVGSILEESRKEENSVDQETNDDECSVESDGESEVTQEHEDDEESTPDDGSEMEISEDTISGDGCREDFSEEVTSKAVPEDDSTADYAFEQYVGTVDDAFEQDGSPANGHNYAQKEFCITRSNLEVTPEETSTTQETYQDGSMDGMVPKELEITACRSGISQESNLGGISTCVDDAQVKLDITTCKLKDASEESNATEESVLKNNAENVTDGAAMGPEITRCNLENASEESGIDQDTAEDDDSTRITRCMSIDTSKESATTQEADQSDSSANVSSDAQEAIGDDDSAYISDDHSANVSSDAQEAIGDDDSAYISDDAQDDLEISKYNLEDASKEESVIAQEADQNHSSANVSSYAQDESEHTTSELAVIAITDGHQDESKISTCKSEGTFEESVIGQEADHDGNSVSVADGTQNEYEVTLCHSEGAQVESDVIQEDEDAINTAGSQKKSEITACESGGASLKPATPQEADGDVNNIYASDGLENDTTMPILDACKDVCVTEEADQSLQIPADFTDAEEPSIDDICGAFSGMNLKGDVYYDPAESATCPRNKLIISRRRRTPEEEEYLRGFNPRAPNFLPLELDADAEKVDLKHQMMDERKNAEEWMIDYALRRAVTNLAPARKKKVELLVQAFETVLPHDEDDKKSITPTRPAQACN
ncbi:unnamed protein product [Urochloa decumbens]|uniref:Calmodulin-binding domain-containing protein n=1 Tax=Urochloa decumbens TaxID=240449 RepID=A0ABC8W0D0_9POAL